MQKINRVFRRTKLAFLSWIGFIKHNESTGDVFDGQKPKSKTKIQLLGLSAGIISAFGVLMLISIWQPFLSVNLAGQNITNQTNFESLDAQLNKTAEQYQFVIKSPNQPTKLYSLGDAGITINTKESIQEARKAKNPSSPLQRLAFWQTKNVPLTLNINRNQLQKFIDQSMTVAIEPAINASLAINKGQFEINAEKSGKAYSIDDPENRLISLAQNLQETQIDLSEKNLLPKLTIKHAETAKKNAEKITSKSVAFTIAKKSITATPENIASWIDISPAPESGTFDLAVNSGRLLDYLNAISAPYVSPPQNAVLMPNTSRVLIAGRSGVDIVNKEQVASEVAKKLVSEAKIVQELPVSYQRYKTIKAVPYDKWIAVDLSSKRMYAYEKDNLVNTFLVSAGAPETPTVVGNYKIYRKVATQNMSGPNADGTRYFQPNVQWVNYFYQDYAIHGNYWRPVNYFGNINSSHGCVGIVNSDASWVYNWAPIGTPVVTF